MLQELTPLIQTESSQKIEKLSDKYSEVPEDISTKDLSKDDASNKDESINKRKAKRNKKKKKNKKF